MAERSKAHVYGRSLAGIAGSNLAGGMDVCCECRTVRAKGQSQDNQDIQVRIKYREKIKKSPVVSLGIFSDATDRTMCPGVDSASINEYQKTPGGKDGQCVRVTTLPPS